MAGLSSDGKMVSGLDDALNKISKMLTTRISDRTMREWVGNPGTKLIGENITEPVVLLWITIIWSLIEIYEPRIKIKKFEPAEIDRSGTLDVTMTVDFRPHIHKNWVQSQVYLSVADGAVTASPVI